MDGMKKIKKILERWSGGWGITDAQPVLGRMGEENRKKALEQVPGLSALLCCVLPYYAGEEEGNLSLYARGEDYHQVAGALSGRKLQAAGGAVSRPYIPGLCGYFPLS